jgi:hypothetical protein
MDTWTQHNFFTPSVGYCLLAHGNGPNISFEPQYLKKSGTTCVFSKSRAFTRFVVSPHF